jgi:cholesterol oxidase
MSRLSRPLSERKRRYDVVIVGSGYGGGVSASRLARAGRSVAVLERGREILTGEFPAKFPDLKNEFRVSGGRVETGKETSLYDVRLGDDMHIVVGSGLGGGSLINAGVALKPDRRVFDDPIWPGQIRQDGLLQEGFRRAAAWLRPSPHPGAATLPKYKALERAASDLKETIVACPVAVSFDASVNAAGVEQPACTLCGDCCAGCNVGAKNTVAMTYLPDAARHGAEIITEVSVSHIERCEDGGWLVETRTVDDETGDSIRFEAGSVILAAGTLGSTEILLRSRERGLSVSDQLGQRFSANGDIIAFGYGATEKINAIGVGHPAKIEGRAVGATVSGQLEIHDPDDLNLGMCVQEGALPSAIAPALPVMFLPDGRLLGALKSLINGVYNGPFAHLQTYFAVSHDSSGGRFVLENDKLKLAWPEVEQEPVFARLDRMLEKIVHQGGGDYVKNPLAGPVMGHQPATAHPLGGCVMGADATVGVVNHKCQVFDTTAGKGQTAVHDGLYVVDGSVVARSLGVNPLLTITALSERAMIHFAQDHGLAFDAAPISKEPISAFAPGDVRVTVQT